MSKMNHKYLSDLSLFIVGCLLMSSASSAAFAVAWETATGTNLMSELHQNFMALVCYTLVFQLFTLGIPAWLYHVIKKRTDGPIINLKINAEKSMYFYALLGLVLIYLLAPLFNLFSMLVLDIVGLKEWALALEDSSRKAVSALIDKNNGGYFIIKVLIIAVLPAVCEELVFRNVLFHIIEKWTGKPWITIFVTAFLFALVHFQPFGFLAFMLLGVFFGYFYHITRDIKLTMLLHFLFNLTSLVLSYWV